ncbi:MAG: helix-turn-helix transcriptional regulator [Clostridia bacterium]|nr:helix-turn-helix transcriptional regulator [Clostridia bacterium]
MHERIRQVRKCFGLTLDQFGEKIGLKKSVLSRIENGYSRPQEQTLRLICRVFGVSYAWLKDGVGEMLAQPDEDDAVNRLMLGQDEFPKQVFRALAAMPPEGWDALRRVADLLRDQGK